MTVPVKAKVVLIDPSSMTVVWMNEPARADLPQPVPADLASVPVDRLVPNEAVPDALRAVAGTGEAMHVSTDLVSTVRGSVAVATSIYRLPDGLLLMVTENAFQPKHEQRDPTRGRRQGHRAR